MNYNDKSSKLEKPSLKFEEKWISDGIKEETINYAEKWGKYLAKNGLTTSQIRNFFGEVKRIQTKLSMNSDYKALEPKIQLLKPKLAYAAARAVGSGSGIKEFETIIKEAISKVNSKESYNNFVDFFEAILAYHKANEGRGSH